MMNVHVVCKGVFVTRQARKRDTARVHIHQHTHMSRTQHGQHGSLLVFWLGSNTGIYPNKVLSM